MYMERYAGIYKKSAETKAKRERKRERKMRPSHMKHPTLLETQSSSEYPRIVHLEVTQRKKIQTRTNVRVKTE